MTRPPCTAIAALMLVLALAGAVQAAQRLALPLGLQAAALLCVGEMLKLCPRALKAPDRGIVCLWAKRRLSALCRGIYDQGVSRLRGGDVHPDLRALWGSGAGAVQPGARGALSLLSTKDTS